MFLKIWTYIQYKIEIKLGELLNEKLIYYLKKGKQAVRFIAKFCLISYQYLLLHPKYYLPM